MRLSNVPILSGLEVLKLLAAYGTFSNYGLGWEEVPNEANEWNISGLSGEDFDNKYPWFWDALDGDDDSVLLNHLVQQAVQ